jgi:imidazolonepropionase-like amidohydrolase
MRIGGVRVFDGEQILPDRDVVVSGGVITDVTEAAGSPADLDGRGRTLLPGFFDAHVHLDPHPDTALRHLVESGITTALDMFSGGESLTRTVAIRQSDPPDLADVRTAGSGATAPGSMLEKLTGHPLPTVADAHAAHAWVQARIQEGADYIKIIYDEREGGPLTVTTLTALIEAAHDHGVLAVAHTMTEHHARTAVAAGIDGLAHLFIGADATADFGRFAADHDVFVIPTLIVLRGFCGYRPHEDLLTDPRLARHMHLPPMPIRPADPSRHHLYTAATKALRELTAAGVAVLAGTDTSLPTATLGVFGYGATLHAELELLVKGGLSPTQTLIAATSAPARAFRIPDRGFIRPGMRADLLLVDGDPTNEIRDTRNIVAVWKRGARIHPHTNSAPPSEPAPHPEDPIRQSG